MTGRPSKRAMAAAGALAVIIVLGACATLPPSGRVRVGRVPGASGPAQQGVIQFVPVGPSSGWTPQQIVNGFLIASADFANDHAIAREYLAPSYRSTWKPGLAATVVDALPLIGPGTPVLPHVNPGSDNPEVVQMTSQHVAVLSAAGQFQAGQYLVSSPRQTFQFGLVFQSSDGWRIAKLPTATLLLLTEPDFLRDYEPRNLYFMAANSASSTLIPDPVFIPQQLGTTDAAAGLVNGLLWQPAQHLQHGESGPPAGWLASTATTAFPPGTTLLGVQVTGSQATVDLGGNAAKASPRQWQQMAAQLVWSLTSSSYGTPTAIRSVVLQLNHKNWHPAHGQPLRLLKDYQSWVPVPRAGPVYFQGAGRTAASPVGVVQSSTSAPQAVPLPEAFSRGPFHAIAISPGPAATAILAGCRGKNVYVTGLQRGARVSMQTLPASCTSLSWDGRGNLWATTKTGPYVLPPSPTGAARQILPVSAPPALLPPAVVTSLRVAPDGVRVAMIVRTKARVQVLVAAISEHAGTDYLAPGTQTVTVGSDVKGAPVAVCWWDADHLLALAKPSGAAAQLYEVPLNGGVSTPLITPANAISLAVSGTDVLIGTAGRTGQSQASIRRSTGLSGPWRLITDGSDPVAPG